LLFLVLQFPTTPEPIPAITPTGNLMGSVPYEVLVSPLGTHAREMFEATDHGAARHPLTLRTCVAGAELSGAFVLLH